MKSRIAIWFLFFAGLLLRLAGLPFKGMHDIDQVVLEWGAAAFQNGLAHTPIVIYGIFSYAFHEMAFALAQWSPRFWWAPQKFWEIASETGIYFTLVALIPAPRRWQVMYLFWINPFFILSGGWLGFWDGPHTLAALLAVLALSKARTSNIGWILAGIALSAGAMFKPQGLIYFVVPATLLVMAIAYFHRRFSPARSFALGCAATFAVTIGAFYLAGGDLLAIPRSYMIGDIMPNLCNTCTSVWRPVTRILQHLLGQTGALYDLRLPQPLGIAADRGILLITIGLIALFVVRVARVGNTTDSRPLVENRILARVTRVVGWIALASAAVALSHRSNVAKHGTMVAGRYSVGYAGMVAALIVAGVTLVFAARSNSWVATWINRLTFPDQRIDLRYERDLIDDHSKALLVLTFGALCVAQLATRAHISHTYSALVLLVPFAIASRRSLVAWLCLVTVHLYGYLASYQFGPATAMPTRDTTTYPQAAHELLKRIDAASHPGLLSLQAQLDRVASNVFPFEPALSVLSGLAFVVTLWIIREMFVNLGNVERLSVKR